MGLMNSAIFRGGDVARVAFSFMGNQPYTPTTRALRVNFYHLKSESKFDECLGQIAQKDFELRTVEMRGMRYRMREVTALKRGQFVAEFRKLRTKASGEVPRKEHLKSGEEEEFNLGAEEAFAECTAGVSPKTGQPGHPVSARSGGLGLRLPSLPRPGSLMRWQRYSIRFPGLRPNKRSAAVVPSARVMT